MIIVCESPGLRIAKKGTSAGSPKTWTAISKVAAGPPKTTLTVGNKT